SGTGQACTQTGQVPVFLSPGARGRGSRWVEVRVDQSVPSAPMTWVPKVTVPSVTGCLPVLRKSRVTFSHQRTSVSARPGLPIRRPAGAWGPAGTVGDGGLGEPGPLPSPSPSPSPSL